MAPQSEAVAPQMPAARTGKDHFCMKAYHTQSPYYFASKHVLPAGSLVFFSEKLRRYVHPTDGILYDPHPRLHPLSDTESQALEAQWHEALRVY